MNKTDIAKLLTIASGFDRRDVDDVTIEAWALVPEFVAADVGAAVAAVVAHQTGPKRSEYLTIGHIVDALRVDGRSTLAAVEADVRSAKARGLVPQSWPARQQLSVDVQNTLTSLRDRERQAANAWLALDGMPDNPINVASVGKEFPG